ncbi:MAG TPA: 2-dehydro-3-deoxy-6-phosphogalactonate aldolase [Acetobacteraceae bacterium]|nr:2-dehydro-3-deoxy-6-phosphogalactonate aldolase [Acetobacteraceae bacterium]
MFHDAMARLPLIAILRGITPDAVVPIGAVLAEAGFAMIEVPLNSPEPIESVARLQTAFGDRVLIGAGTVASPSRVAEVAATGAKLLVMPHADVAVIRAAKDAGMICIPGIMTPTEGFAALAAGADALKLFPAELVGPSTLRAMRSVFPAGTLFLPVGGIAPDTMGGFLKAGAAGFGLGSALYRPGDTTATVAARAAAFTAAWRRLQSP